MGVGSIARRHIRNLNRLSIKNGFALTIDALRRKDSVACDELSYISSVYTDIERLPNDYDVIFLTNPTQFHASYLVKLQHYTKHFFIEKPVATPDTVNILDLLDVKDDSVYYVACPLRYHQIIQYLKKNIKIDTVRSVRCICSSYLPEWRPGTDYKKSYSARKELGGGVSTELIHEWDYLNYLFGMPKAVQSIIGKISNLDISSDDIAVYIARYQKMTVELHLDYFGRKAIRTLELITDDDTILADFLNGTLDYAVAGEHYDFSQVRDDYQLSELEHFITLVNMDNSTKNERNGIESAIKVLRLTQGELAL